ncbi:MAG: hypothetical protein L0287_09245 [Anaerolineae bacterium]|nr:hypothetical protein [Anaerolineae bacterium]MCI0610205.1 hypothetical protein [Anaerolineae bacterium]
MKHNRIYLAVGILVLASLACQALTGGGNEPVVTTEPGNSNPPAVATQDTGGGNTSDSGFPMTADAYNITEIGDGSLLYYTKLSLEEVMAFYRAEYTSKGYTERELLTVVSDGVFSMVFDGDPSGKGVVIQSVDLGDGSRTVAIRLEDV